MKFAIVSGSHRENAQSAKVAKYLVARLKDLLNEESYLLDLANNPIPLWDEGMWNDDPKWSKIWGPHSEALKKAEAIIIVAPEWGGMVPSGLKNFFLLCGHAELGHKAGLIVSVSAARGGAYPVAELRMSSYKNNQICYMPEHLIIRDAENVLNEHGKPASEDDQYLQGRCDYALKLLNEYAKALTSVRHSGVIDSKAYPNGM